MRGFDDFELSLGDIMRGERATMGKSLLDVQRELKIKATYIAAIENTDPTAFETPGFVAGYVRSYARYLNLDPEWAYKTFCDEGNFAVAHGMSAEASGARPGSEQKKNRGTDPFTDPKVSFIPKGEAALSQIEPRAVGSVMVLVALLCGLGYGGWSVMQEVQKVRFAPVEQAPGVLSNLDPLAPALTETTVAGASSALETPDIPRAEALGRLVRPEALEVPVLTPRDASIATLDPSTLGVYAPEPDPAQRFANARRAPTPLNQQAFGSEPEDITPVQVVEETDPQVVLFAVRPSWVRVRAADGTVIFEKILEPGEEFTVPLAESPPVLRAGNAGSVYVRLKGETFGPMGDGASVAKNIALAPTEVAETFDVADLSQDPDLARFVAVAEAESLQPATEED